MIGRTAVAILAVAALPLGGCIPMMAANVAGMAVEAAQPKQVSNESLKPQAKAACSDYAARYGPIHLIDVEQNKVDKIIVWGTVETAQGRRSFECGFGTAITYFKLREIRAGS